MARDMQKVLAEYEKAEKSGKIRNIVYGSEIIQLIETEFPGVGDSRLMNVVHNAIRCGYMTGYKAGQKAAKKKKEEQ